MRLVRAKRSLSLSAVRKSGAVGVRLARREVHKGLHGLSMDCRWRYLCPWDFCVLE